MVERGELDRGGTELPGLRSPQLETPEAALNQLFAWAVRRDPSGARAEPGGAPGWGQERFEDLLESARIFRRVGPGSAPPAGTVLLEVVGGLFGVRADAPGGRFELAPWIPEAWRTMVLRRLRCHRTLLDLEVRARAEWLTVRLELVFGPPIPVAVAVRNTGPIASLAIDEVPLPASRAVFTLQELHEVTFFMGASP